MKSNEKSFLWTPFAEAFFCAELPYFRAVKSIYSLNDFIGGYVCCRWMCLRAGECFLFKP